MSFPAKTFLAWLLVLVLLPKAKAADPPGLGIGNQMTNMFDIMLNHTAPTAHLGQRRGVLTGGSVNARNRIMNEAAPVIAVEMTQVILNDLLFAAEQAAALNEHAYAKQLQIQIAHAREQLFREYEVLDDRYGNPQTLLAYYQGLVEAPCRVFQIWPLRFSHAFPVVL